MSCVRVSICTLLSELAQVTLNIPPAPVLEVPLDVTCCKEPISAFSATSHAPDNEAVLVVLVFIVIVAAAPQAVIPPESPSAKPLAVLLPPALIFRFFSFAASLPPAPPLASTRLLSLPSVLASPVPMDARIPMLMLPIIALRLALFWVIRARLVYDPVTVFSSSSPWSFFVFSFFSVL